MLAQLAVKAPDHASLAAANVPLPGLLFFSKRET
jgi:hypothetical protein